jgi:hypothetical protein
MDKLPSTTDQIVIYLPASAFWRFWDYPEWADPFRPVVRFYETVLGQNLQLKNF